MTRVVLALVVLAACDHGKPWDEKHLHEQGCWEGKPPGPDLLAAMRDTSEHDHDDFLRAASARCTADLILACSNAEPSGLQQVCTDWHGFVDFLIEEKVDVPKDCSACVTPAARQGQ